MDEQRKMAHSRRWGLWLQGGPEEGRVFSSSDSGRFLIDQVGRTGIGQGYLSVGRRCP